LIPLDLAITTASVATVLSHLHARTWSAKPVATAFYKRAMLAQQLIKCCTELMFGGAGAR
jgi:amidase